MFDEKDLALFSKKGITPEQVENQLESFKKGFPYLELEAAASCDNCILAPATTEADAYVSAWKEYLDGGHRIVKFVPASGAASRMFKDLFGFLNAPYDAPETAFEKKFFAEIENFAFYSDLNAACKANEGKGIPALIAAGNYKAVVANLLEKKGLGYGQLPKGLLRFHAYGSQARTPLEEHMAEGALYASGADGHVNLHFTVSPEHRPLFEKLAAEAKKEMARKLGVIYDISFSEQKSSTDTVAADMENKPFREDDGSILFRPGGHGALIQNLNEIDADVVFIKNIDNVVPDHLKDATVRWKQVIAGVLVQYQEKAFSLLRMLDSGYYDHADLEEAAAFVTGKLHCHQDISGMNDTELASWLRHKLNRPMRVCGMVRNVGEPGGGPFLAKCSDGSFSPQILESSQINMNDERSKSMFTCGTHFNPVDLVCALKDYNGSPFDLPKFVDPATGFISSKSKNGRELKALELPGLWNGAMSDWNTIFVEVPLETFNPVKTVNDLLRPQHQKA